MFASGKIACFMQNFFCKSDDHFESTSPRSPEEVAKASTLQRNLRNQSYRRNRRISSKRRKTTATPKGLDVPEIRFIQTNSKNCVVTIPSDKETKETSNSDDKTIQTDTSILYKEMNKRVVTPPEGQSALHLTATTVCIVCTITTLCTSFIFSQITLNTFCSFQSKALNEDALKLLELVTFYDPFGDHSLGELLHGEESVILDHVSDRHHLFEMKSLLSRLRGRAKELSIPSVEYEENSRIQEMVRICSVGDHKRLRRLMFKLSIESFVARIFSADESGLMPIEYAIRNGHINILKHLQRIPQIQRHCRNEVGLYRLCYSLFVFCTNSSSTSCDGMLNALHIPMNELGQVIRCETNDLSVLQAMDRIDESLNGGNPLTKAIAQHGTLDVQQMVLEMMTSSVESQERQE